MKIKTQEKNGGNFTYRWSSHTPVIYTALELLKPELIVELGIGFFSSPIFFKSDTKKTIHVENTQQWIDLIKDKHKDIIDENKSEFLYQNIGDIKLQTKYAELNDEQKKSIDVYYKDLSIKVNQMNYNGKLMFTDGFTALRRPSIDILTNNFDMAIYHDAEDTETYDYNNISESLKEQNDHYLLKTATTYTGFFIKKDIYDKKQLNNIMNKSIDRYTKEISISKEGIVLETL
jgi:hypothetical protein